MQSLFLLVAFVCQASALALSTAARPVRAVARSAVSMKVGLVYSTTTGNTETVRRAAAPSCWLSAAAAALEGL